MSTNKSVVRILIIKAVYFSTHFQAAILEDNYYVIHISTNFSKELEKHLITSLKITSSGSLKWKTAHFSRSVGALVISECV